MRPLVITVLIAAALSACSPSTPEPNVPASATPTPAAAPAPAEAKPVETAAAPVKEVPVGECGDQSKLPADQRIANTARWTTASEQDNFGFEVFRGDSDHRGAPGQCELTRRRGASAGRGRSA